MWRGPPFSAPFLVVLLSRSRGTDAGKGCDAAVLQVPGVDRGKEAPLASWAPDSGAKGGRWGLVNRNNTYHVLNPALAAACKLWLCPQEDRFFRRDQNEVLGGASGASLGKSEGSGLLLLLNRLPGKGVSWGSWSTHEARGPFFPTSSC